MNLLLSNKIRLIDPRRFFADTADQPCWYSVFEKGEKRRQSKWKIGVKYLGEKEEHALSLTGFEVENNEIWSQVTSQQFAIDLLKVYRTSGIKAAKEWLKDVT